MHYEFMARLFPQQRPLIHFWTDVKKSVGQKWIYFDLAHQVVQEFRYRRFRVINRTLYTYFSICFYLCLITLEWIWNKSPVFVSPFEIWLSTQYILSVIFNIIHVSTICIGKISWKWFICVAFFRYFMRLHCNT